jgi:UDP-N-acetylglucosamine--N-acetylmuramyl-(pentapeptide) pyrophosphoryl-undecaprenol N-acetylglucosamine transferase
MKKIIKIVFTGGGTGGHIFPIIAIARELRKAFEGKLEIFFVGPRDEIGKAFFLQEGIKVKEILAGKIRRYLNFKSLFENVFDILFKMPVGIFQAFFWLFFKNPDLIFSKGGYGSFPVVISGWILGIPIFLHESDIVPGLTNRILSKFALEVFVSFPKTEYFSPKKMILVGNPIRREILEGKKEKAIETFKLTNEKPVVLILGGSQGAQRINEKILEILPKILEDFELIHQCGNGNYEKVRLTAEAIIPEGLKKYYHLSGFLKEEQLKNAFAAADLIISRAGSGTIFEIAAWGKSSILIPLPESAQAHQIRNAYAFHGVGAAKVIEEENLTPGLLLERLKYFFHYPKEREKMEKAAKEFSKPFAARVIANYILDYLTI